jgi:hypothetical protein
VELGISEGKIKKIKTRIVSAMNDFCKTNNFPDLVERIGFLCGNFSINDRDRGRKRLAGIFFNYHLINPYNTDCGLAELDRFLHYAIMSGNGPVYRKFKLKTTKIDRQRLASFSFSNGFQKRIFMHYTGTKLKSIQECWKYA